MGEVAVEQVDNTNGDSKTPSDATLDETLHEKLISQIEYYFSDVNLSRDKFMQQQIRLDEGWVPLDLLLKFRRLASILGDKDKSVIIDAVRKSTMLEVNSDDSKVRRGVEHPLPDGYDELRKTLMTRTVYCKGFPLEDITFDQIFEFFNSFGKIESVIMRHFMDKATKKRGFKGSVFVTFPTVEEAEQFLNKEEVKYNDSPLIKKWQSVYIDDQRKERLEDKLTKQQRRRDNKRGGKKSGDDKGEDGKEENEDDRGGFPLGAVVHFTGIKENSSLNRDQIRAAVESKGQSVAFIEFCMGDLAGYVRLDQASAASKLVEKIKEEEGSEGKLKVGDEVLEVRVLEGEEETNYLDRARKEMNKRRHSNAKSKRKHRGGRGGHFGGDRGRKRKGGFGDGGPPAKAASRD